MNGKLFPQLSSLNAVLQSAAWGEQSKCSEGRRGRRSISGEIWGQSGGLELMPASHYPSTTTTTTDPTMAGALQCISGVALGVSGSSRSSCPKLINPRRSWPLVMVMVIFNPRRCQSRLHHTTLTRRMRHHLIQGYLNCG